MRVRNKVNAAQKVGTPTQNARIAGREADLLLKNSESLSNSTYFDTKENLVA